MSPWRLGNPATSATADDSNNEIGGTFDITITAKPDPDLKKADDNFRKSEQAADEELKNFLANGPYAVTQRNTTMNWTSSYDNQVYAARVMIFQPTGVAGPLPLLCHHVAFGRMVRGRSR